MPTNISMYFYVKINIDNSEYVSMLGSFRLEAFANAVFFFLYSLKVW